MKTDRNPCSFLGRTNAVIALAVLASWLLADDARAFIAGPYTADASTLHLWHLDETAVPCIDSVSTGAVNLNGLLNGATLSNPAYVGFGTCLSTLGTSGLGAWTNGAPVNAGLFPTTTSTAATTITYAGTNGAFTMEALICPLFPVTTNFGTVAHGGDGRTSINWQLVTGESGTTGDRIWQWRFDPVGVITTAPEPATGNTSPLLDFINVDAGGTSYELLAAIPTNGPNAIASNQWFHIAVTYSGVPNTAGNFNFYWTAMNSTNTSDNLILSTNLTASLPQTASTKPSFAIGNTGRSDNGNWLGLIDEVRISSVARSAVQMMFQATFVGWVTQPTNQFVAVGSTVTLVSLASGTLPSYQWTFNSTNLPGATSANLVLTNIGFSQGGPYAVIVTNSSSTLTSSVAVITIGDSFSELFNTGVNTNGVLLSGGDTDPHWQLAFSGDPNFPGPAAIAVGSPPASYFPDGPNSLWIAPVTSGNVAGTADYGYETTFLLDTMDPTTAVLNVKWGTDNNGLDILLNGVSTGATVAGFNVLSPFVITNGYVHPGLDTNGNPITITNLFVPGLNTLECIVSNAPGGTVNPTGLRVELSGIALPLPPTAPQILAGPQSITTNALQSAQFSVVATGSGPLFYQWYLGPNAVSGQTSRTLTLLNLDPTNAGTYTVVVSNSVGTNSANAMLTVTTPPLLAWLGVDPINPTFWDTVSTNWLDTGSLADEPFSQGDDVEFTDQGAGTPTINVVQPLSPNAVFFNSTATYTLTSSGGGYLTGSSLLIMTNTGTLILDTPNNNTGQTIIQSGIVQVGNSDASGALGSGPVTDNGTLVFDRTDSITVGNQIGGTGGITMNGSGVLALSGDNTYTGPTLISSGGTINALNTTALGGSSVTVSDGGQLYIPASINLGNIPLTLGGTGPAANGALFHQGLGSGNTFGGPIILSDYAGIVLDASATLNLTNAAGITGTNISLAVQCNGATSLGVVSGPVSLGSGSFTEYGSGTWELVSSNNNWTGGTIINSGGTLQIGDGGNDGSIGNGPVSDSGTLAFNSSTASFPISAAISDLGKLTFAGPASYTISGQLSGGGTVTDNSSGTMVLPSPNSGYSGVFTMGGTGFVVPQDSGAFGGGSITVGVAQTDTCALRLMGNLNLPNTLAIFPRAFGSLNNPAQFINVSDTNILSSSSPIVIPTGGNLLSFESDSGKLSVATGITAGGGSRDLVFKGAGMGEVLGNISLNGANNMLVWKLDSGTWTFWGTNTPGQATTISNGTLVINGSMDADPITVAGGLLTGTGAIAGPVTVNAGAAISPGPGLGTLTISSNLTLLPGSTTTMLLSATTNSQIAGATSISYSGTLVVSNLGASLSAGASFPLFPASSYTGSFSSSNLPALSPGLVWGTGTLALDGSLHVSTVTRPTFATSVISNTNLVMNGSGGGAGVSFSVLTSTNAAAHVSTWTVLSTGSFDSTGHFNITNGISPGTPARFFLLRTP